MLRKLIKRYLCDHKRVTWIQDEKHIILKPGENKDVKEPTEKTLWLKRSQVCDDCGEKLTAEFNFR